MMEADARAACAPRHPRGRQRTWVPMKPHVLIAEDNFFLAANLADIVTQDLNAHPVSVSRVSEALKFISDDIAIAFLDIELLDGKSYPVARKLIESNIPIIFVSGDEQASLPGDLKDVRSAFH